MSHPTTRWIAETGGDRGPAYAHRMRALAASGADLDGEARFLDALLDGPSRVLDAGCGTGRVALALARLGHDVTGVDGDLSMVTEARADALAAADADGAATDVRFVVGDLLDVATLLAGRPGAPGGSDQGELDLVGFDLVAAPGNVMVYLAPGTEQAVVAALAGVLRPGGLLVAGFAADRHVTRADYLDWCEAAGLRAEASYATWDGDPDEGGEYVVTVHRR